MKGQAVNFDWVIGLSLFMVAMIASAFAVVNDGSEVFGQTEMLQEEADDIRSALEEDLRVEARRFPLIISGGEIGRIPVDRQYVFPESAKADGSNIEGIGKPYVDNQRIVAVPETGDRRLRSTYFLEDVDEVDHESYLEVNDWINNTDISILPGSNGLESMRYQDYELLNEDADLDSTDYSTNDKGLYAESLGGGMVAYTNTTEFIVKDSQNDEFNMLNFTTLYWEEDGTEEELYGTGTFRSGETSGLVLGGTSDNDYAVTFANLDSATVSKPDNLTVRVETTSPKLRVRLHEGGISTGQERLNFQENGWVEVGASRSSNLAYQPEIDRLDNLPDQAFEAQLDLRDIGYNISFGSAGWGESIPLRETTVNSRSVPIINDTGKIYTEDLRVAVWR